MQVQITFTILSVSAAADTLNYCCSQYLELAHGTVHRLAIFMYKPHDELMGTSRGFYRGSQSIMLSF